MARWRDTSVILVAMMVAIPAIALGFTAGPTDGVISPTWQYTFCMDDVPSGFAVSQTQAEASLSQVVSAWENTAGVRTGQAISIAIDNQFACTSPQSSADAYVTFVAGGALAEATILGSYTVIRFNQEEDWVWEGPATGKYSFAGVLGHEMGHALSLAHAGTGIWGSDGDLPSMTGGFELGDGAFGQTTERDDRGGAVFVRSDGAAGDDFWNVNPGFEGGTKGWASQSVGLQSGLAYKKNGTFGGRLTNDTGYLQATHVYDPWSDYKEQPSTHNVLMTGMDATPDIYLRVDVKTPVENQGLQKALLRIRYRKILYRTDNFKRWSSPTQDMWTSFETIDSILPDNDWWELQDDRNITITRTQSIFDRAAKVRIRVKNNYDAAIYIDEAGMFGGT